MKRTKILVLIEKERKRKVIETTLLVENNALTCFCNQTRRLTWYFWSKVFLFYCVMTSEFLSFFNCVGWVKVPPKRLIHFVCYDIIECCT